MPSIAGDGCRIRNIKARYAEHSGSGSTDCRNKKSHPGFLRSGILYCPCLARPRPAGPCLAAPGLARPCQARPSRVNECVTALALRSRASPRSALPSPAALGRASPCPAMSPANQSTHSGQRTGGTCQVQALRPLSTPAASSQACRTYSPGTEPQRRRARAAPARGAPSG